VSQEKALTEPQDDAARATAPETDTGTADAASEQETDELAEQMPPTPVPSPGGPRSSAAPGTAAAAAAGVDEGADASPGGWTAIAVPGSPDGEVDTRA